MHDVGCPDPAAVVAIMERMLSLRAFSLMAWMVEEDGPAVVVTLIGLAPLPARFSRNRILHRWDVIREPDWRLGGGACWGPTISQKILMWPIRTARAIATNTSTNEPVMIRTAAVICFLASRAAASCFSSG